MSAATIDRQMEILEQIHALKRELQELAGDALVVTIAPAKKNGKPGPKPGSSARIKLEELEPKVREAFGVLGESTARGVSAHFGLAKGSASTKRITETVRALAERGELTVVKKGRGGHPIYRLAEETPLQGGASSNGYRMSPRTRKSLERAAMEAADAEPENELHERLVESLRLDAGTLTELAMRLDAPRRDIAAAIEELLSNARIVECGLRMPLRHKVYGVAE